MFEELFNEVCNLHHQLMVKNGHHSNYEPRINIYLRYDTYHDMCGDMPMGFSRNYEIVESRSVCGHPIFLVNETSKHPPWLIYEATNRLTEGE